MAFDFFSNNRPPELQPVALLIQAQTGPNLAAISEEIKAISAKLNSAGYKVKILKNPTSQEIQKQFDSDSELKDRITILHYAGHSDKEGLILPSDKRALDDRNPESVRTVSYTHLTLPTTPYV